MQLVGAAIIAAAFATNAYAEGHDGERLAQFMSDECSYLSAHFGADVPSVLPHFGRVKRIERITQNVATPHPRSYFEANGLRRCALGWKMAGRAWSSLARRRGGRD